MKHITKLFLLAILVVFASCQNETLSEGESSITEEEVIIEETLTEEEVFVSDGEEDEEFILNNDLEEEIPAEELSFSLSSNSTSASSSKEIVQDYTTINLNRCDASGIIQNFWWPTTPTTYNSGHFYSDDEHQLKFTKYNDGTAKISGQTIMGTCLVDVDVWLKDKMDWDTFSSPENGGTYKDEDNDCTDIDPTILDYYVIDSTKSSITATGGDCLEEGTFGVEQRPDPTDENTSHLGVLVGKGAGLFDAANKDMEGLSTWGWITKDGERKWILDFNFNMEPIDQPCNDCDGGVTELVLEFDWKYAKKVDFVQRDENTYYGKRIYCNRNTQPGEKISLSGKNSDGTFGKYIYIFINNRYYTKISTDCYIKLGPGYFRGVFNVISGESSDGGELCEYVKTANDYSCRRYW